MKKGAGECIVGEPGMSRTAHGQEEGCVLRISASQSDKTVAYWRRPGLTVVTTKSGG